MFVCPKIHPCNGENNEYVVTGCYNKTELCSDAEGRECYIYSVISESNEVPDITDEDLDNIRSQIILQYEEGETVDIGELTTDDFDVELAIQPTRLPNSDYYETVFKIYYLEIYLEMKK